MMTADDLMLLIGQYALMCDELRGPGLHAQITAEVTRLHAEAAKSERRAIMFGDVVHQQVLAMRAAAVDSALHGAHAGMHWILNTLEGPGQLPDLEEARKLGGAQALFDKEMAEHEAFRKAHPAP